MFFMSCRLSRRCCASGGFFVPGVGEKKVSIMDIIRFFGFFALVAACLGAVVINYCPAIKAFINSHPLIKEVAFIAFAVWLILMVVISPFSITDAKFKIAMFVYSHSH